MVHMCATTTISNIHRCSYLYQYVVNAIKTLFCWFKNIVLTSNGLFSFISLSTHFLPIRCWFQVFVIHSLSISDQSVVEQKVFISTYITLYWSLFKSLWNTLYYPYTGCSLTHGTNFDNLYKNSKATLFQE